MPILNQILLIKFFAVLAFLLPGEAWAQNDSCQPLSPRSNESVRLDRSGNYCLGKDLHISDRPWFFPDGRSGLPSQAVLITADNVIFDLGGHDIQSGDVSAGIQIRPSRPDTDRSGGIKREPQQITIRNGTLRVVSSDGVHSGFYPLSIASDMGDPLEGFNKVGKSKDHLDNTHTTFARLNSKFLQRQLALRPTQASDYQHRGVRIENMRIDAREGKVTSSARGGAINIQGAGTIIRGCVIETDAGTALWIFGPNAVIEDNAIIVHGAAPLREADAPIRLHQADGAVIRNNKFIIKDNANHRAISVFATGAFTIENNTFYGMTEKDEVAKAFTGKLESKEMGNRFEPAWKAALNPH